MLFQVTLSPHICFFLILMISPDIGSLAIPSLSLPSVSLQRNQKSSAMPPTQALYPKHPCWRYLSTWCANRTCNHVAARTVGKILLCTRSQLEEMEHVLWLEGSVPGWTRNFIEREARKEASLVTSRGVPGFERRGHRKLRSLVCSVPLRAE